MFFELQHGQTPELVVQKSRAGNAQRSCGEMTSSESAARALSAKSAPDVVGNDFQLKTFWLRSELAQW